MGTAQHRCAPGLHTHEPAARRPEPGPEPSLTDVVGCGRLPLPVQLPPQGAEPLLFAAADPAAENGGYYGPGGRFEMTGPTAPARVPSRARDKAAADRLWTTAEALTGVALPTPTTH